MTGEASELPYRATMDWERNTPMRWSSLVRDRRSLVFAAVGILATVGVVASVLVLSGRQSLVVPLLALTLPVIAALLAIYLLVRVVLRR